MDATFSRNKDLSKEGLIWVLIIIFLSTLSFLMLIRDARKQYGAVAFGVFPVFDARDSRGERFDQHQLHGQLSAVIVTDQALPENTSLYLYKFSRLTSIGKKFLVNLVLVNKPNASSDRWVRYLTLNEDEFEKIHRWRKGLFKDGIILVDQNGVIRGVFDLEDKLERLNFEAAVKGIL